MERRSHLRYLGAGPSRWLIKILAPKTASWSSILEFYMVEERELTPGACLKHTPLFTTTYIHMTSSPYTLIIIIVILIIDVIFKVFKIIRPKIKAAFLSTQTQGQ